MVSWKPVLKEKEQKSSWKLFCSKILKINCLFARIYCNWYVDGIFSEIIVHLRKKKKMLLSKNIIPINSFKYCHPIICHLTNWFPFIIDIYCIKNRAFVFIAEFKRNVFKLNDNTSSDAKHLQRLQKKNNNDWLFFRKKNDKWSHTEMLLRYCFFKYHMNY